MKNLLITTLSVMAASATLAGAQSFTLLAPSGGVFNETRLTGVSNDGSAVIGYDNNISGSVGFVGFQWSPSAGRVDFPVESVQGNGVLPSAISGDGSRVFGSRATWAGEVFLRENGQYTSLGGRPGYWATRVVAADTRGRAIVGHSEVSVVDYTKRAFLWRAGQGMMDLGALHSSHDEVWANDVSDDGGVVVGRSAGPFGGGAFVWTPQTGMVSPPVPQGFTTVDELNAVSPDGRTYAGVAFNQTAPTSVVRWRDGVPQVIGVFGGESGFLSHVTSMSDDGRVIVGWSQLRGGGEGTSIWHEALGTLDAAAYLNAQGATLPAGFVIQRCTAVSGDGNTFVGHGQFEGSADPLRYGFVATIPAPGSVVVLGVLAVVRRRR